MSIEDFEAILAQQFSKEFVLWNKVQENAFEADDANNNNADTSSANEMCAELSHIEKELNDAKAKVDRIVKRRHGEALEKWRSHTKFTHTLKDLPKRILDEVRSVAKSDLTSFRIWNTLYTQAYCKMMELIIAYPELVPTPSSTQQIRTLHLCEAPGGFVCALRDYLHGKVGSKANESTYWRWWINSLQTGGLLLDGNFEGQMENLAVGPSADGDIFKWDKEFIEDFTRNCGGKFSLVTADGSFDCTDNPIEQESSVRPLIVQEIYIALRCICCGGNFVLKTFTFFSMDTIKQVLLPLISNFERVICRKPASSKPGNSEIYLICLSRLDEVDSANDVNGDEFGSHLTPQLIRRIVAAASFFARHQLNYIEFNLRTFCSLSQSQKAAINIRKCAVIEYMTGEIIKRITLS